VALPPRVAKLIFEKRTEPKPKPVPKIIEKPEPKPVEKKKPEPKKQTPPKVAKKPEPPKPPVDAIEQARKKASSAGLLALQDSLADLRDQSVDQLRGANRLSNSGSQASQTERSMLTSKVGNASSGINTAGLSRDAGSTTLATRTATEVKSAITKVQRATGGKRDDRNSSRSIEEIQIVFDRNKSSIYSLYNRALRKNPTLQGKLVLSLTIAPSGKVTAINMVSSDLSDATLENKLIQRIKMFDFGAKAVEAVTITYPIDFLPA
jgi:TonB family protein